MEIFHLGPIKLNNLFILWFTIIKYVRTYVGCGECERCTNSTRVCGVY